MTYCLFPSGSSTHLDISGCRWISLDIVEYCWIRKDIYWISLGKIGYLFRHILEKISTEDIQEISSHIQKYPNHISIIDIHGYLSNRYGYPFLSKLNIHFRYPWHIHKVIQNIPISRDIQIYPITYPLYPCISMIAMEIRAAQ